MDSYHSAIFQNLRLLTQVYRNLDMETKLQKGMFKKPNTKGMQSVFYSLISILNPEYCQEFVPWPVSFTSDNYKFRVAVINFIEKECTDFEPPKLLPSLLNKADGEKYVRFVFSFVTYTTKIVLEKKFNKIMLTKPSFEIDCNESTSFMKNAAVCILTLDKENENQHKVFMKKSCEWLQSVDCELQGKLQEFLTKKEKLAEEVKDALSYTYITEETMLQGVVTDLNEEVMQLQRNQNILKSNVFRILKKKEHLLRLIHLKERMQRNFIDIISLKPLLTEAFAKIVKMPLPMIMSSLFMDSDTETFICLKTFLYLGYKLVHALIQRFTKLNPTEKQLAVCQSVNDIFCNVSKRFDELSSLNSQFSCMINECQQVIPDLEKQYRETFQRNSPYADVLLLLKFSESYYPHLFLVNIEKPLWIDTCTEKENNYDPVAKIKKRMRRTPAKT